jgi:hypothetical protein
VVALDGLVVAAVARWGDQLAKPAGEGFRALPSPKGTTLLTGGGGDSSTAAAAAAGVVVGKGAPVGRRQAAAPACALLLLLLGLAPALPAGLCGWGVFLVNIRIKYFVFLLLLLLLFCPIKGCFSFWYIIITK